MSDKIAQKATASDSEDKLPPTPPGVMAVLIVILIGLMFATYRAYFHPSPPATWKTIHEKPDLPMTQVNEILSKSGATIDSIKPFPDGTLETWQLKHRTGTWTMEVKLKKTPSGLVYASEQVRCYITNFPSFTRSWDYPATSTTSAATPAVTSSSSAPAAPEPAASPHAPAAPTPAK